MPKQFNDRKLLLRGATLIWGAISLVNFTVWAGICVIGQELTSPWWLWVALPPAFVLVPLWWRELRGGGGRASGGSRMRDDHLLDL